VAVVADIDNISGSSERYIDGEPIGVKIGHGRLLEMVYTGDVFF